MQLEMLIVLQIQECIFELFELYELYIYIYIYYIVSV